MDMDRGSNSWSLQWINKTHQNAVIFLVESFHQQHVCMYIQTHGTYGVGTRTHTSKRKKGPARPFGGATGYLNGSPLHHLAEHILQSAHV